LVIGILAEGGLTQAGQRQPPVLPGAWRERFAEDLEPGAAAGLPDQHRRPGLAAAGQSPAQVDGLGLPGVLERLRERQEPATFGGLAEGHRRGGLDLERRLKTAERHERKLFERGGAVLRRGGQGEQD